MTMNSSPQVSVLLPVYNCPDYVGAAIDSILNQSFNDFELIIIDDGSIDNTPKALDRFNDPRIRRYQQDNQGLAATLNRAISLAKAPLLARQDQDDLSMPERLKKQVAYMQANPECGLLGTWAQIMEIDKLSNRFHRHPTSDWELRYGLLFNNPFVHSSVMLRKSIIDEVGGYTTDPERQPPEDYELWSRISRVSTVSNIPESLLIYREIPTSMSRTGVSPFQRRLVLLSAENIAHAAAVDPSNASVMAISCLIHGTPENIQGVPRFRQMRNILFRALEACAEPSNRPALQLEANFRLTNMRASWLAYQVPALDKIQQSIFYNKIARICFASLKKLLNLNKPTNTQRNSAVKPSSSTR